MYELQVVKVMLDYVGFCDIYNAIPDAYVRKTFRDGLVAILNDNPNMFFVDKRVNAAVRDSSLKRYGTWG